MRFSLIFAEGFAEREKIQSQRLPEDVPRQADKKQENQRLLSQLLGTRAQPRQVPRHSSFHPAQRKSNRNWTQIEYVQSAR